MANIPHSIGRYDVAGRLAAGGMAEILLARLTGTGGFERAVVIKRILPHLAAEATFRTMFLDEARLVARIRHPNVVQVQELGEDNQELFLVMEYLEGETASALLKRAHRESKKIDWPLAAWILAEACAGLHAAHELRDANGAPINLVHRDVSPQNVFVGYAGAVKVLDFGIAKAADRITRTETGTFKGKFEYASPEQCLGTAVDRRSDIFALGVVLYELTTGRRLYRRDSQLLTMQAIISGEVPRPSSFIPDYPASLEAVCMKALSLDPNARHATAAEMRSELLRAARSGDLDPEPDAALARLMNELFADRMAEKSALYQCLREGNVVGPMPSSEGDAQIELPIVEATQEATTLDTEPSTVPSVNRSGRGLRRMILIGAPIVAAASVFGGLRAATQAVTAKSQASSVVATSDIAQPLTLAPTVAPMPTTVTITVASTPPGAEVVLDERTYGSAPATFSVPRASRPSRLTLKLAGHQTSVQDLVPDADQRVVVALTPVAPKTEASVLATPKSPRSSPSSRSRPSAPAAPPAPAAAAPAAPPASDFRRFD